MVRRPTSAAVVLAVVLVATGTPLYAHPLGQTSVNRDVGVRPGPTDLEVDYLLDLAELPAWTEIESLDADHDGAVTPAERDHYLAALLPRISLALSADGHALTLRAVSQTLDAPPGQDGLSTLRIAIVFRAVLPPVPDNHTVTITVTDTTWSDRPGWREIDPDPPAGYLLVGSSLSDASDRARVRANPTDHAPRTPHVPRGDTPREDHATFVFRRTVAPPGAIQDGALHRQRVTWIAGGMRWARARALLVAGLVVVLALALALALALVAWTRAVRA